MKKTLLDREVKGWQVIITGMVIVFVGMLLYFYSNSASKISEGGILTVIGGTCIILMPIARYLGSKWAETNKDK